MDQAKALTIHHGHTSHGEQLARGLEWLEHYDTNYSFALRREEFAGLPSPEDPPALRMYSGNGPCIEDDDFATCRTGEAIYVEPRDYWRHPTGIQRTELIVGTGDYDLSMFSWCSQMCTYNNPDLHGPELITEYLSVLDTFDQSHPNTRFIFATGTRTRSYCDPPHHENNVQAIRQHVADSTNKILFDFWNIESTVSITPVFRQI